MADALTPPRRAPPRYALWIPARVVAELTPGETRIARVIESDGTRSLARTDWEVALERAPHVPFMPDDPPLVVLSLPAGAPPLWPMPAPPVAHDAVERALATFLAAVRARSYHSIEATRAATALASAVERRALESI